MEDVTDVYFSPLTDSAYVRPFRFNYTQDGREKTWDLLEVHDSVTVVIFNVTRRKLVFVKQFRPAVYFNCIKPDDREQESMDTDKYPPSLGVTLEICAGIVDKALPLEKIACEEVLEECGYKVEPAQLQKILSYRAGVGVQGATQTAYYVEVTDEMQVHKGGGVEDELIQVVELSIPETEALVARPPPAALPLPTPPSCLFALMWFLRYKADKWRKSFERHCGSCKASPEGPPPLVPILREEEVRRACPAPAALFPVSPPPPDDTPRYSSLPQPGPSPSPSPTATAQSSLLEEEDDDDDD